MVTVKNAGQFRMEIQNERELTHTDVPAEQGGVGEYPTPVVLFAQSLMACALTTASMGAAKEDVDTTGWHAELKEIGFDAAHSVVERIAIHFHFGQDVPEKKRKRLEAFTHRGCTVGNSINTGKIFTFEYDV